MQIVLLAKPCRHIVFAGYVVRSSDIQREIEDKVRSRCGKCGEVVEKVSTLRLANDDARFNVLDDYRRPRTIGEVPAPYSGAEIDKAMARIRVGNLKSVDPSNQFVREVIDLSPARWRENLRAIPVVWFPTSEPNAGCIRYPGSTVPIILLHTGIATYFYHQVRGIFPYLTEESRAADSSARRRDIGRHAALVGHYARGILDDPPESRESEYDPISDHIALRMAQFFYAHELAHAALLHADQLLYSQSAEGAPAALARSRELETEADAWAQDCLVGNFVSGRESEIDSMIKSNWIAPCLAFVLLDYLDRLASHVGLVALHQSHRTWSPLQILSAAEDLTTHPPHRERFLTLFDYVKQSADNRVQSTIKYSAKDLIVAGDSINDHVSTSGQLRHVLSTRLRSTRRRRSRTSSADKGWEKVGWVDEPVLTDRELSAIEHALSTLADSGEYDAPNEQPDKLRDATLNALRASEYADSLENEGDILGAEETRAYVRDKGPAGMFPEAIKDAEDALANKDYASADDRWGTIVGLLQSFDDGGVQTREAIAIALDRRSRAKRGLRDFAAACSDLEEAIGLTSQADHVESLRVELATVWGLMGRFDEAVGALREAADGATNPESAATAAVNLGALYSRRGMSSEARRFYLQALSAPIGHNSEIKQQARENLARLGGGS